jgi:hypothetical protein
MFTLNPYKSKPTKILSFLNYHPITIQFLNSLKLIQIKSQPYFKFIELPPNYNLFIKFTLNP